MNEPSSSGPELPRELIEQLRDAVWALSGPPRRLTLNQLASDALARELQPCRTSTTAASPFRRAAPSSAQAAGLSPERAAAS